MTHETHVEGLAIAAAAILAACLAAAGCDDDITCGPGTRLVGTRCMPDDGADADADADVDADADADQEVDAADADRDSEPDADDAGVDGDVPDGDVPDGDVVGCDDQCDCPAGTTCVIDGFCEGDRPCTEPCEGPGDCECGRECVDGFCLPHVGSGDPCELDCDCQHEEYCVQGSCTRACSYVGWRCTVGSQCEPCGKTCEPFTSACVEPGECWCNVSCAVQGLTGTECVDGACVAPPGSAFFADITDPIPIATCEWFPCEDTTVPIEVASSLVVGGVVLVVDVMAGESPWDFSFSLTSPDGAVATLAYATWDCAAGGVRFVMPRSSEAFSPWDDLVGESAAGTWTVGVVQVMGTGGSLVEATLYLE
jgi:hypothetical protein